MMVRAACKSCAATLLGSGVTICLPNQYDDLEFQALWGRLLRPRVLNYTIILYALIILYFTRASERYVT